MADEDSDVTQPEQPDQPAEQSTQDLLRELLAEQRQHRAEVAELRDELAKQRTAPRQVQSITLTPEELYAQRMQEIEQHEFYCAGCGRLYDYPQRCTGSDEAPHPAIEVISTDELKSGDPSKHTEAPGVRP